MGISMYITYKWPFWIAGWWFEPPLKNMTSSVGMMRHSHFFCKNAKKWQPNHQHILGIPHLGQTHLLHHVCLCDPLSNCPRLYLPQKNSDPLRAERAEKSPMHRWCGYCSQICTCVAGICCHFVTRLCEMFGAGGPYGQNLVQWPESGWISLTINHQLTINHKQ